MNAAAAQNRSCERCGAPLSPHDLEGLCTRCVARLSLLEPEDGGQKSDVGYQGSVAGDSAKSPGPSLVTRHSSLATAFGDYELLDEIARGGMGVVYRARQVSLDRVVAVKMLLLGQFAAPAVFHRFRAEAAAAAKLQHPNIVAIHDIGEQNGQPFFSMDYVAGRNLGELVRDRPLPARAAAQYLVKIARAVQYAHEHGILHRDLKPANILIDESDEPRITDFGLAKQLRTEAGSQMPDARSGTRPPTPGLRPPSSVTQDLTLSGQILGSPNFLSPEQAGGHARAIGPACDIYGLGSVLYYLLTARPPFAAETFESTLFHVLNSDPVPPRQLNPSVPRDLETICLKCLEKEPGRRYDSARVLGEELDRFLKGEPIQARPIGQIGRTWRWCRRKPALAGAFAAIATLLLTVTAVSVASAWRIATARKGEQREAYYSNIALANQYIEQGSIDRALETLWKCPPQYRHWEWGHLLYLCHQDAASFQAHATNVTATFFSPDSRWVVSQDAAGLAKVWDWELEEQVFAFGSSSNRAGWLAFHPSGAQLAAAMGTNGVWVWATTNWGTSPVGTRWNASLPDAVSSEPLPAQALTRPSDTLSLSDGERAGVRGRSAVSQGQQPLLMLRPPGGEVTTLAYSPDGQRLVTGGADGAAAVWDSGTGQQLSRQETTNQPIRRVAISPDGQRLVAVAERAAWVWELNSGKLIRAFPDDFVRENPAPLQGADRLDAPEPRPALPSGGLPGANLQSPLRGAQQAQVPEGRRMVAGGDNPRNDAPRTATALEGRRNEPPSGAPSVQQAQPPQAAKSKSTLATVFADDTGQHFATIDFDGNLTLWREGRAPQHLITIQGSQPALVRRVFFAPDSEWVINAGEDNTARLWALPGGSERLAVNERVHQVSFNADSSKMVTLGTESWVTVWDLTKRRKLKVLRGHNRIVQSVAISRDGKLVVTGDQGGKVKVWSASLGRELGEEDVWQNVAVYSPDGQRIVSSAFLKGWIVRSSQSGRVLLRVHPANEAILAIAFSPDGRRIVTAGPHKSAKVWDVDSGRLLLTLRGHRRQVLCVAWSRDGRLIATGSFDGRAKLWDARSGDELRTLSMDPQVSSDLTGWSHGLTCVEFDELTSRLITGSTDGMARVWDIQTGALLKELQAGKAAGWVFARFRPDGKRLVTYADGQSTRLWESSSGRLVWDCKTRGAGAWGIDISADGRRLIAATSMGLVAGHDSGTIEIWDIEDAPRETLALSGRELFFGPSFSRDPEGPRVVTASADFGVYQWEAFPWNAHAYGEESVQKLGVREQTSEPGLAQRVRWYARSYWGNRLAAERGNSTTPPPKVIELPVDRASFPNRAPGATPKQIDLTDYYTGELNEPFFPNLRTDLHDNDLSQLPVGLVKLGGVPFDIRGVIQLRRVEPLGGAWQVTWNNYPVRIDGIPVGQEVRRIHLLLGAACAETEGTVVGSLVLHNVDGRQVPLDLVYGGDVRDWWFDPGKTDAEMADHGKVVWTGTNPVALRDNRSLRLYLASRENPLPGTKIATIDFVSAMSGSAPFLIALTVD